MLKYTASFIAGFLAGKIITSKNISSFKKAAIKSWIIVKDEITSRENIDADI